MRHAFLLVTALVLAPMGGQQPASEIGERQPAGAADKPKAPFVHAVIIYLRKDAPKDAAEKIIADSHALLAKVPTVRGVWAGRPSDKSTPKFGVTDFHVGRLMLFDNFEGVEIYLKHKLHEEYVERHGKHIERVLVYDFANQPK